ncbi:hypothetical protein JOD96_000111 [Flavobacterium sp. 1355]|nr:hypothetical protein [Flavobacterium sp. 1355]
MICGDVVFIFKYIRKYTVKLLIKIFNVVFLLYLIDN